MDKREEIQEGMADRIHSWLPCKEDEAVYCATQLTKYLDSVKVVRIVDREFPENVVAEIDEIADRYALRPNYAKELIGKILEDAGYIVTERLIKNVNRLMV